LLGPTIAAGRASLNDVSSRYQVSDLLGSGPEQICDVLADLFVMIDDVCGADFVEEVPKFHTTDAMPDH
jgi:hypothetical protein